MTAQRAGSRSEANAAAVSVPFTDLAAMAAEAWEEVGAEYLRSLFAGEYVGGPAIASFERQWANYCGVPHAVGVANGTDALELTLTGLGIRPGDEVIVPANTFVATAAAVARVAAKPHFVDVDDETLLMSAATLRNAITRRTRAVIIVHLYGQIPDMDALLAIAAEVGVVVIEDAAQAHGAQWRDRRAGSFGEAACFSFYPGKNLGAFGDAGSVVSSDRALADKVRTLANHGRSHGSSHHDHEVIGRNSRMDALQAIALSGKLRMLDKWTDRRIEIAERYRERLCGEEARLRLVAKDERARHVYHLFVIRVRDRDRVREELLDRGIETGIHYPLPCHQQPAFRGFAREALPVCETAAREQVSLPIFPHMTNEQVDYVCESLLDIAR